MFLFAIFFLAGDVYCQSLAQLPSAQFMLLITIMSLLVSGILYKYPSFAVLSIAFTLGLAWASYCAYTVLSFTLPKNIEGKCIKIIGSVASLPVTTKFGERFEFETSNTKVRLLWKDAPVPIRVGNTYQLQVKLKRIHASQNPGTFDFEAWALQKGIRATGYVVKSTENKWLAYHWYHHPLDQLRQKMHDNIIMILPKSPTSPWLIALMMGERENILAHDWQVLRNTGTNHLMAIGGLHIGILSGGVYLAVSGIAKHIPRLLLSITAIELGALASLFSALTYSAFAGFSIPTQRASLMLTIFIIATLSRRKINSWHAWSLALLFVLVTNPLSILTESIWLSFGTIALIIFGMSGRLTTKGWWWKWGRVQWVIGIGLIPLTLAFFQECSLLSCVANTIAIPWMEFLILPFCLLSCVLVWISPDLTHYLLLIADKSLALLWRVLSTLSQYEIFAWHLAIPNTTLLLITMAAVFILFLPAGTPGKGLGIIWLLPVLMFKPKKPELGDYWVSLLDVGQGLAVHIQTRSHHLIYDAGPKLAQTFDAGESVVIPYLRTRGVNKIDTLVVSHGDNDHIGGAEAILKAIPVNEIKTSVPEKFKIAAAYCLAGQSWQWDRVSFTMLSPSENSLHQGNDSSCVLRIDNGHHSILLTGDIEKKAEKKLLLIKSSLLTATILVAPHHGSKTSGLNSFISMVHPTYVLYATGYRNRYHFPHPSVVESYKAINTGQYNTVELGAMIFYMNQQTKEVPTYFYRLTHKRYWYD